MAAPADGPRNPACRWWLAGWASASCTGPVKASALFRSYNGSVATGEASVIAMTVPRNAGRHQRLVDRQRSGARLCQRDRTQRSTSSCSRGVQLAAARGRSDDPQPNRSAIALAQFTGAVCLEVGSTPEPSSTTSSPPSRTARGPCSGSGPQWGWANSRNARLHVLEAEFPVPTTCDNSVGVGARNYNIPLPIPPLRQE